MSIKKLMVIAVSCSWLIFGTYAQATTANKVDVSAVKVQWKNVDKFRDIDAASGIQKRFEKRVMNNLDEYLKQELSKYLKRGQQASVTVYNLDLAGDVRPVIGQGGNIRIIQDIYPPMIDIEYVIKGPKDQVVAKQRKRVRDIGFNMNAKLAGSTEALAYEKRMLKRWLRESLAGK
ncbi:DUF3016 domain-containing protein [Psychrobium sp. 1_MG-2023]|uniref:DUF3016 domain-containing protein n=1 Tax=Psychrobium sp. 1_MG-2023 TaxID=3062624 RepID=UPI000C346691|nr:DUF3016 domain-containing protein [Psychrobium sp. 1_MG-2023]MDP2560847.1 DUF3016 domain-containing protein [Psychrobium sp. 1_MG-2023]PKF56721.1 DUF3016 domain-containing protein [Alteromonadales bacterium alter-6D02]